MDFVKISISSSCGVSEVQGRSAFFMFNIMAGVKILVSVGVYIGFL